MGFPPFSHENPKNQGEKTINCGKIGLAAQYISTFSHLKSEKLFATSKIIFS